MRVALILVLLAFPAHAQDIRPGMSAIRRQGNDFLMSIYRLPDVQHACSVASGSPVGPRTVVVPFDGPGHEFTVDCEARRAALELTVRFYRSHDVSIACEHEPGKVVTVTQLGYDIPVDCRTRANDLPLFEAWLKDK